MNTATAELRIGFTAWAAFMFATCAYCLVHQAFVSAVTPDLGRTLTIALREWGAWALLAPWALRRFDEALQWRRIALTCLGLALVAASLPIAVDLWTGERGFGASLALFWPRNLAMAIALLCIARLFIKSLPAAAVKAATTTPEPAEVPAGTPLSPLLVSKGADQCLIRIEDIQHLSASGNYVDIRARGQNYLLRSTLSDLEAQLPAGEFVRIHRSHIVRVSEIERIRVERSGSGAVRMRDGGELAISKAYRAQLRGPLH
jgi:hypothetical protein